MSGRDTGLFAASFILFAALLGALLGLRLAASRQRVPAPSADTLAARRIQAEAHRVAAGSRGNRPS